MKHNKEFSEFTQALYERLGRGEAEYGEASFQRPPAVLVDEISEELLDVCGWSWLLWCRLRELKRKLEQV